MSLIKKTSIYNIDNKYYNSNELLENLFVLNGKIMGEINKGKNSLNIQDYEFKVFSQNGEDGIIQFLINKVNIKNKVFVEFGVENYSEANTKFLLLNNGWSGLIIDGNKNAMNSINQSILHWKYDLNAIGDFITKDNINQLILSKGISGEIGLLSVDIDGNDYWVLKEIEVIQPQILIVEYNSLFGPKLKITVLYDENFIRTNKHFSNLYYGASIYAITDLAKQKGYDLVGSNSFGNNLFFIRHDCNTLNIHLSVEEAYVQSKFRESRNELGELSFLSHTEGLELIKNEIVYNLETDSYNTIKEIFYA